jgi:hypothetical protein
MKNSFLLIFIFVLTWANAQSDPIVIRFKETLTFIRENYINPYNRNLDLIFAEYVQDITTICSKKTCTMDDFDDIFLKIINTIDDDHLRFHIAKTTERYGFIDYFSATDLINHNPQYSLFRLNQVGILEKLNLRFFDFINEANKRQVPGIIIDLRSSFGGDLFGATAILGSFITDFKINYQLLREDFFYAINIKNGTIYFSRSDGGDKYDDWDFNKEVGSKIPTWHGPVAVLISRNTASIGEVLADSLQYYRKGRVFGEPTRGGLCGLHASTRRFDIDQERILIVPDAKCWRGDGSIPPNRVTPDEYVPFDQVKYSKGHDTQLETAILWLKTQQK